MTSRHDVDGPNAIDANAVVDADGRHWLVYGSFFGGIHALELDPATGLAVGEAPGILLARRPRSVEGAVEGAFVLPRPDGGYALVALVRLALLDVPRARRRLRAADRPVRDRAGRDLTDLDGDPALVGTLVLAGHPLDGGRPWLAPGHASVLTDGDRQLLVHHVRDADDPTQHEVQVRRLVWTADGWPVVSPQPWAGDAEPDDPPPTDPADARRARGSW